MLLKLQIYVIRWESNVLTLRHFVKGIRNRIFAASKLKSCSQLLLWQNSILNTVWYALATCEGIIACIQYMEMAITLCYFLLLLSTFKSNIIFLFLRKPWKSKADHPQHSSPHFWQSCLSKLHSLSQVCPWPNWSTEILDKFKYNVNLIVKI